MPETQGFLSGSGILRRIVGAKRAEVEALLPMEEELRERAGNAPPPRDLASALSPEAEVALMAEVKRRSPGAGLIRPGLAPGETARTYEASGAAAVSVLTDRDYFGGSLADLWDARGAVSVPVLRKDFVIHPVQLAQARAWGADGVLLIARILPEPSLESLHAEALELGLTPLVEVHGAEELDRVLALGCRLIGINNRNLETFGTSLSVTLELLPRVPPDLTVVSESGIRDPSDVERLGAAGVNAVLVGESLLRADDPGGAASELTGRPRVARPGASASRQGMEARGGTADS